MAPTSERGRECARALAAFIDASPTPFHACAEAARMLEAAGFRRLSERDAWDGETRAAYVLRSGALVAWRVPEGAEPSRALRLVGAHTDSPNLRVKPRPDGGRAGCRQLAVEVYGGALVNSWLDRDLGLSGRAWVGRGDAAQGRLFRIDRPILRIPQLAIHLDRSVREDGLKLNVQTHLAPVFALGEPEEGAFRRLLADALDADPDEIGAWDAMLHDTQAARLVGLHEELLSAPRLDNLCSCFVALRALVGHGAGARHRHVHAVALFDHEEVGSGSERGASGPLLRTVLERSVLARGGGREDLLRALAGSACVSADMAHATHPNYPERHEPGHWLAMNAGPVVKINTNMRYASDAETEALFQDACERADVPFQKWVNRSDLACGSTIGPLTAANLGVRTVDVGCAQLAMHSVREVCGALDPELLARALGAFLD